MHSLRSGLLLLPCLALANASLAVEPTPGVAAVAAYAGPGRSDRLIAAAKKEGELMLYSSLTQEDQLKLAADFKRRYGVTVNFWRGSQTNLLHRVTSETRGGRFEFDAIETNAPQLEVLAREKLLQKMNSPYVEQELLPETTPAHGEWAADRLNLLVYVYNTDAVKPPDLPQAWQDLLDPKWKGRIGLESSNAEWFGALVSSMGEKSGLDLFQRMAGNGVAVRTGHTHSTGRVIAGEIPLVLGVYSHDVDRMKAKGAPVNWFLLPPAIVLPSAVAVSRRAPHPNAAALFYDYMLTDGQRLYLELHRIPANKNYDTPVRRLVQERLSYKVVNPQVAVDEHEKWRDLYKRTIVERSQY
jgi:iron(III) transport system substrate-binding protein